MCNDFGNRIPYSEYVEAFSDTRLPLKASGAIPNLEPCDDIWPTDTTPVLRLAGDGIELVQLRWGFAPGRPKAGPVINFRSEGRRFANGRCLVPASFFFEFTGWAACIATGGHVQHGQTLGRQQNDPRPFDVLMGPIAILNDRGQTRAISGGNEGADGLGHMPGLAYSRPLADPPFGSQH